MASPQRILVLGTSTGGGNWPPLAAVTVGLHQAGHAVQCFGDAAIAQDFASAAIAVDVVPAEDTLGTFLARWRAAGASGPSPFRVRYQENAARFAQRLQARDAVALARAQIEALLESNV